MRITYRIMSILLMICIPLISIIGAYNIVLRMPDLYVYEFNRVQLTDEMELGLKDEEFGQFFSDYMIGKTKSFELVADYQGKEQDVFQNLEQRQMKNLRHILNISLYALAGMLLVAVACYMTFLSTKRKQLLRGAFKNGIIVFLILIILSIAAYMIPYLKEMIQQFFFLHPFAEENLLSNIYTIAFMKKLIAASTFVSVVILIISGSITWRLTKPRRMFW